MEPGEPFDTHFAHMHKGNESPTSEGWCVGTKQEEASTGSGAWWECKGIPGYNDFFFFPVLIY